MRYQLPRTAIKVCVVGLLHAGLEHIVSAAPATATQLVITIIRPVSPC